MAKWMTESRTARAKAAFLLPVLLGALCAQGADDAVYRRAEPEGADVLTNVPENDGYELLVVGTRSTAVAPPAEPRAAPATAAQPVAAATREPGDAPDATRRDGAAAAITPDDPEVARRKADMAAGQAVNDITAAGGAAQRLQSLYEASRAAAAAQRAAAERSR